LSFINPEIINKIPTKIREKDTIIFILRFV